MVHVNPLMSIRHTYASWDILFHIHHVVEDMLIDGV